VQAKAEAQQRWQRERERLLGPGPFSPDVLAITLRDVAVWLDTAEGRASLGMTTMMEAVRAARGRALQVAIGEGPALYQELQRAARQLVRHVAGLPALPGRVWSATAANQPAEAFRAGGEATWAELVRSTDRWQAIHRAGGLIRGLGCLGQAAMMPHPLAYEFANYAAAAEGLERFKELAQPLRLRYAIDHQWRPGLHLVGDLAPQEPERPRRGPLGFLVPSPLRSAAERLGVG
jgi:hypothetical protein